MDAILKRENELDELVDEIVRLTTNSRKLAEILKTAQDNEAIQRRNLGELNNLKLRIIEIENRLDKLTKAFKTNSIETARLITENYEEINEENEQKIMNLQDQIESLRSMITEVKRDGKVKGFIKAQMR